MKKIVVGVSGSCTVVDCLEHLLLKLIPGAQVLFEGQRGPEVNDRVIEGMVHSPLILVATKKLGPYQLPDALRVHCTHLLHGEFGDSVVVSRRDDTGEAFVRCCPVSIMEAVEMVLIDVADRGV